MKMRLRTVPGLLAILGVVALVTTCDELVVEDNAFSNVQSVGWEITCRGEPLADGSACRMDVGQVDTLELRLLVNDTSLTGLRVNWLTDTTALSIRTMDEVLRATDELFGLNQLDNLSKADSLLLRRRAEVVALKRGEHLISFSFDSVRFLADGDELEIANALSGISTTVVVRERWGSVAAGLDHSCALTYRDERSAYGPRFDAALRDGGQGFCWGVGPDGALGTGSFSERVPVELATNDRYLAIAAGRDHTCATGDRGLLSCWGRNEVGQLGTGDALDQFFPKPIALGIPIAQAALGDDFTCGFPVSLTGEAIESTKCWGSNVEGQLGCDDGDPDEACFLASLEEPGDQLVPSEDVKTADSDIFFSFIAAGARHACGIEAGFINMGLAVHTAWCWGDNTFGQLGDSSTVANCQKLGATGADTLDFRCRRVAVPVQGPGGGAPLAFQELAAGDEFTCGTTAISLIGQTSNEIYCWGRNDRGQLGDGTLVDSDAPVRVVGFNGPAAFVQLVAGGAHACAVAVAPDSLSQNGPDGGRLAGPAFCWGSNSDGQLGDGSTVTSPQAVRVSGGFDFSALAAGAAHTCGVVGQPVIVSDPVRDPITDEVGLIETTIAFGGPVYCWGDNQAIGDGQGLGGKLGNGSTEDSPFPVRIAEPASF